MLQADMPAYASEVEHYRAAGLRAAEAHRAVHAALRAGLRDRQPAAYDALLAEFRAATVAALPVEAEKLRLQIDAGHSGALQTAIAFLAADPWFFRSGYVKAALIRSVKRADLDELQRTALQQCVFAVIAARDRREFRVYCSLAARIATPEFSVAVQGLTVHADPAVRRRARWVAAVLDRSPLSQK